MKTKNHYTAPGCVLLTVQESSFLCQSLTLGPIIDNPDIIELNGIQELESIELF